MNIHGHSAKAFQIELFEKEVNELIGNWTGFFCSYMGKLYIVTNYHVLSWRNPFTWRILHKYLSIPGKIKFGFDVVKDLPDWRKDHIPHEYSIDLYDSEDNKTWLEHPMWSNDSDVVAYEIDEKLKSQIPKEYSICSINLEEELAYDANIRVMDSVFIIGFPMQKALTLSKFPIYKAGKIASEPQDMQNGAMYYVDSKTKPGMSGSLVVQKEEPEIVRSTSGQLQFRKDKINFIGIYSGRAEILPDEYQAELWIVWPFKEYLLPILEDNTLNS